MKTLVLSTTIAMSLGTSAFATEQLARSLGVEPGTYTTAELVQMKFSAEDEDGKRLRTFVDRSMDIVSTQSVGISAGVIQLAASLGVDPADYTLDELVQLHTADASDDRWRARSIINGGTELISTQSIDSVSGKQQLAANLGVDPATSSVADLAREYQDKYD